MMKMQLLPFEVTELDRLASQGPLGGGGQAPLVSPAFPAPAARADLGGSSWLAAPI